MTKMRKVKRSLATAVLVWVGRRMIGRVQKQTLKSVTRKPKAQKAQQRFSLPKKSSKPVTARAKRPSRRRTAQGFAFALLSAAAVAALKVGVDHVIENERDQQVVIPDFDVFADDDE